MPAKSLIDLIDKYKIVATLGSCKNAGKTTVLNYMVHELWDKYTIGITSIGYDGEDKDHITNLPKPKIIVHPGMLVATAQSCLAKTEVEYDVLYDPLMTTVIGPILIVKINSRGSIEVSGPSMRSELKIISRKMIELGCQKIMLDGAAGRLSFGVIADLCIYSVGAALSTNIRKVVKESQHKANLLQLKGFDGIKQVELVKDKPYKEISYRDKSYFAFRGSIVDRDVADILKLVKDKKSSVNIIVNDPTVIFISPKMYHRFRRKNGFIYVRKTINLQVITINPMSPYGEWFEPDEFLSKMSSITELPVYDVLNEK